MARRIGGAAICLLGVAILALAASPEPASARPFPYVVHRDINYDLGSPPRPPATPEMNYLDIYRPRGGRDRRRPLVVWIHGGGWRRGDKQHGISRKAKLFTRDGYVLASVNYRLSAGRFNARNPNPRRIRFPAYPRDIAEAVAWLREHARKYGIDRRRIVFVGFSAGAHLAALMATDPSYLRARGVRFRHVRGFVTLDSPVFDVATAADPDVSDRPRSGLEMLWNAFGTPAEEERWGLWEQASPITFASPNDPPALMVTQAGIPQRLTEHRAMARALGRRPAETILRVNLGHGPIGRALGLPRDHHGVTDAVRSFVRKVTRRGPGRGSRGR